MTVANKEWCRHFTGVQNVTCEAGVEYQSVRQDHEPMSKRFPCTYQGGVVVCPHWKPYTSEEIEAFDAELEAYTKKMNDFSSGAQKACPVCGEPVTGATIYEKLEPEIFSLYVQPCNHRLGLWSKVPAWIEQVEVVPVMSGDG